ncbi:MAG: hypothetical protein IPP49_01825 [Saprospiraceae bacterium]|nr:hypothetical protein [Saprospiraceae bacterium]
MEDKIFLCSLVVILFCQSTTKAQFWFVQGKTWSYDVTTGFDIHNYGIHRQVVTGDTVIMGKSSKILTYYPKTSPSFVSYVYEENRKVYFFRNFQPELIYDFNLVAGDSLKHKFYSGIVRETGDLIYQDTILKYMIVQYGNAQTPYLQTFLEGIGMAGDPLQNGSYKCGPLIHNIIVSLGGETDVRVQITDMYGSAVMSDENRLPYRYFRTLPGMYIVNIIGKIPLF